jgi:hypothetical protein
MVPRVSVLLVCERPEQVTGSGCCGKLEGDNAFRGGGEVFREARQRRQEFGVLYRAVQQFFADEIARGEVRLDTVDPRNQLYLVPRLWRDVCRYRPGWRAGAAAVLQLFALPAVLVNGRVLSRRGQTVDPDQLCHTISEYLGAGSPT